MKLTNKRIILSKINQIGDVTFALPIASVLKKQDPSCTIIFLGRSYTRALIEQYADIDQFVDLASLINLPENDAVAAMKALQADIIVHILPDKNLAKLAKLAGIPHRIGTWRRWFHWLTCNHFVNVTRKKTVLHEAQVDMHYLKAFGLKSNYSLQEIIALRQFKPFKTTAPCLSLLDPKRFNLVLHPKTRGKHIEWPESYFAKLIELLPKDQFKIFVSGSEEEGAAIRETMVNLFPEVVDLSGKTTLDELMQFIAAADGLIAASTGPIHLAANYGIHALGLYVPIRPLDAGRWGPIGEKAQVLSLTKDSPNYRDDPCYCIQQITPEEVFAIVSQWSKPHANT